VSLTLNELADYVEQYYGPWKLDLFFKQNSQLRQEKPEVIQKNFFDYGLNYSSKLFRDCLMGAFKEIIRPQIKNNQKTNSNSKKKTKILSLPCSSGEEVFSLTTLLLDERINDFQITGMDISERMVTIAKEGKQIMNLGRVRRIEEKFVQYLKNKYFFFNQNRYPHPNFVISDKIKEKCDFYVHDILQSKIEEQYNIIICANLLVYLTDKGRRRTIENLTANMAEKNILILGKINPITPPGEIVGRINRGTRAEIKKIMDYNRFITSLEKNGLNLNKINDKYNVYCKNI
jgi:chemotaxis methyl-accepting protein methylase